MIKGVFLSVSKHIYLLKKNKYLTGQRIKKTEKDLVCWCFQNDSWGGKYNFLGAHKRSKEYERGDHEDDKNQKSNEYHLERNTKYSNKVKKQMMQRGLL